MLAKPLMLVGLGWAMAGPVLAQSRAPASAPTSSAADPMAFVSGFWRGPGCEPIDPGGGMPGAPAPRDVFTPEVVALLRRASARQPRDEPGGLQFGFLSLSQDCFGARPRLALAPGSGDDAAEVVATFQTAPGGWVRSETVAYRLVRSAGAWRVADVVRTVVDDRRQTQRGSLVAALRREAGQTRR